MVQLALQKKKMVNKVCKRRLLQTSGEKGNHNFLKNTMF